MEILSLENLQTYGVKSEEIQKGLKIECFGKSFLRQSDVPKKFREKALFLSAEFLSKGKESFVTETNFSYTVWTEEKVEIVTNKQSVSKQVNLGNNSPTTNINIQRPLDSNSRISAKKTSSNIEQEKLDTNTNIVEKEKNIQWNVVTRDNHQSPVIAQNILPEEESQSYKAYRGVAFTREENPESNELNTRVRKKPRTYRGQIY